MNPAGNNEAPVEKHPPLRISEEYSQVFPTNPQDDLALEDSIRKYGQRDPIVVNPELTVLDGHRRLRACTKLGIKPKFEIRAYPNKLEEKRFVLLANLQRRQLNPFQRAEAGLELLGIESKAAHERLRTSHGEPEKGSDADNDGRLVPIGTRQSTDSQKGKAAEIVARQIGLTPRTFQRALTILRSDVGLDVLQKLRTGEYSIYTVFSRLKSPVAKDDSKTSRADLSEGLRLGKTPAKNANVRAMTNELASDSTINEKGTEGVVDPLTNAKICTGCRKEETPAGTGLCTSCLYLIRLLRGVESSRLPSGKMTLTVSASSKREEANSEKGSKANGPHFKPQKPREAPQEQTQVPVYVPA
ncbi:MAG: ParB N-terminal domain-containing protein [Thaumarchaeota archaeon]|nr:ParB N-terminal domain-containing protein [Nitrososphaerota archaeon]